MPDDHTLIAEQRRYYAALAGEYGDHALDEPGGEEILEALERFRPTGNVLELAGGPGTWTPHLLRQATTVTALDASAEMIAVARSRVGDRPVRFVQADVFDWQPDDRYDTVFFGFWLSHVPPDRFEDFWRLVEASLAGGGRVLFVDDGYRTPGELVNGEASSVIERALNDGTTFRIIKVPYEPEDLERRLEALGWRITVTPTAGPFYWGEGQRRLD